MALNHLLDRCSFRRLQLIELLVSDDIWWTIETLSKQLNCSMRTLITDIQILNNNFQDYFLIHSSKKMGVCLTVFDSFHMDDIYHKIAMTNLNFQLIKLIIELDETTHERLAELLFTSQSSIKRSIEQLNVLLVDYELRIQMNPVKFVGSEKQIRYFYSVFLTDCHFSTIEEFRYPTKKIASHLLEQIEKEDKFTNSSFLSYYRTLTWMMVSYDRVSRGHLIEKNDLLPKEVCLEVKQFLYTLKEQLPFELPDKEIDFMVYIYWNNHRKFDEKDLINNPTLLPSHQNILSFIERIKEETGYTIEDQTLLLSNLVVYSFYKSFFKGPSYLLFNPKKKLEDTSSKTMNYFIEKVNKVIDQYPKNSWVKDINREEFILILILFWKGLVTQIMTKKEKINVLVLSYVGIQQELFLGEILEYQFSKTVTCYPASEKNTHKKDIHLVLTDYNTKWTQQMMYPTKVVIGINIIPTRRDWERIEKEIKEIQIKQNAME